MLISCQSVTARYGKGNPLETYDLNPADSQTTQLAVPFWIARTSNCPKYNNPSP